MHIDMDICLSARMRSPLEQLDCCCFVRGLAAIGSKSKSRLQDDEKTVTLQVGKSVFDSAPRNMRTELWMSSLQRKGIGVAASQKYEDMLLSVSSSKQGAQQYRPCCHVHVHVAFMFMLQHLSPSKFQIR